MDTSLYDALVSQERAPIIPEPMPPQRQKAGLKTTGLDDETITAASNDKTNSVDEEYKDESDKETNDGSKENDPSDFWYGTA